MSFADGYLIGNKVEPPGEKNGAWQPGEPSYAFIGYGEGDYDDGGAEVLAGELALGRLRERLGEERQQHLPRRHHHLLPHPYCQYPRSTPGHRDELELCLGQPAFDFVSESCAAEGTSYLRPEVECAGLEEEPDNGGGGGSLSLPERKRTRSSSSRHRYEIVTELGPEEVRWFFREDKKTWKPFIGYDSLRIELAYRELCQQNSNAAPPQPAVLEESGVDQDREEVRHSGGLTLDVVAINPQKIEEPVCLHKVSPVCVRSGLYEVDVAGSECYPVYWNQSDKIQVMRGQWFVDGTWQPLEAEESNLIEQEHLKAFRGQKVQDTFDLEVPTALDHKDVCCILKKWKDKTPPKLKNLQHDMVWCQESKEHYLTLVPPHSRPKDIWGPFRDYLLKKLQPD